MEIFAEKIFLELNTFKIELNISEKSKYYLINAKWIKWGLENFAGYFKK
jgi:hypothetical protein